MSDSSIPVADCFPGEGSSTIAAISSQVGRLDRIAKRLTDILLAVVAILLLAPLLIVVAVMVRLSTGKSPIYAHRRVGHKGLPFSCYKFCSMVDVTDEWFSAYLATHPEAAAEWKATRKLKHDPRVTRLGRILRESSVDELPQLFNVLMGDMSFVGPRPIMFAELEHYGAVALDYIALRPGLTGLWQVSGRSMLTYDERVRLDHSYMRSRSIVVDMLILVRTIPAVTRRAQTS